MNDLHLIVEPFGDYDPPVLQVVPLIDGRSLVDIAAEFEASIHCDVVGGYAGIVPRFFRYGPLVKYYLGQSDGYWEQLGKMAALGCTCGKVGCWPLCTRVSVGGQVVQWSDFQQPHRNDRDYGGFGPFTFDRQRYFAEIDGVAAAIAAESEAT